MLTASIFAFGTSLLSSFLVAVLFAVPLAAGAYNIRYAGSNSFSKFSRLLLLILGFIVLDFSDNKFL